MTSAKLGIKELCFAYLDDELMHHRFAVSRENRSDYYSEIEKRIDAEFETIEECIEFAKRNDLISEYDYEEIQTAIKIRDVSKKALKKLKKE